MSLWFFTLLPSFLQHLHLHGEALKPIPGAVAELGQRVEAAQPAQGLAVLLQALDQLAQYFGTLSQHEQAFVQQESNAPNCPPSLKSTNAAIASANSQLHVAVRDLTDLVRSFSDNLAAQNSSTLHAALYGVDRIHAALQSVCSLYT